MSEGQKGIERRFSAMGGTQGGAVYKALNRFNQQSASDEYGNSLSSTFSIIVVPGDNTVMIVGLAGVGVCGIVIVLFLALHPRGRAIVSSRGGKGK